MKDINQEDFHSKYVVVLSEVNDNQKKKYLHFLMKHDIEFVENEQGYYVGNIRLLLDGSQKHQDKTATQTTETMSCPPKSDTEEKIDGLLFNQYQSILSEVNKKSKNPGTCRGLVWLIKIIQEVYDARYEDHLIQMKEYNHLDTSESDLDAFGCFIVDHFKNRYGLKSLLDKFCWEVVNTIDANREENREVETFARFVDGSIDEEGLMFFLYSREQLKKHFGIDEFVPGTSSFRSGKKDFTGISKDESMLLGRLVFGTSADRMYNKFVTTVMTCFNKTPSKSPSLKLKMDGFLSIALEVYQSCRQEPSSASKSQTSAASLPPYTRQENMELDYDDEQSAPVEIEDDETVLNDDNTLDDEERNIDYDSSLFPHEYSSLLLNEISLEEQERLFNAAESEFEKHLEESGVRAVEHSYEKENLHIPSSKKSEQLIDFSGISPDDTERLSKVLEHIQGRLNISK